MVKRFEVRWDLKAAEHLKEIYRYLQEQNPSSAEKIKQSILISTKTLELNPEIYAVDRLKKNNKGDFRAYEKFTYRISYRIKANQLSILRVRHNSRKPKKH